ncbi:MAG TPA: 16S rRNA (uracil(1498)-N(3))-methyltransferase [Pyrinomonadaceae bacterium]|nr:16S rRNA (uracil(1498)-N(3))-methyltransferase [Pyrinomonadaceae bacterium]
MSRRRFFAPPSAFNFSKHLVTLTSDEARHLREVLRLKTGDDVQVFDGTGREFRAVVSQARRESAELELGAEIQPPRPESPLKLTLAVALLKGEKFDLVVQKGTELGVNRFIPLVTRYADIRLRDESDASKRVTRWQRIALEAAKQCGRAVVPEINLPISFEPLIREEKGCFLFAERGGSALSTDLRTNNFIAIVGSEGGWSDEELDQARTEGVPIVTLGGRVLRAETAAIATAVLLQHRYGDLK